MSRYVKGAQRLSGLLETCLSVVSLTTLAVASGATLGEGEGEAWPELDHLSLKTEGAGLGGEAGALLGPQLGAQK